MRLQSVLRPFIRLARERRGAQVVELAIVLPIVLFLTMGLIDFGRAYFSWIIVTNAAREGARAAAVGEDQATVRSSVTSAVTGLPINGSPSMSCPPPPATNQALCIEATNTVDDGGERGSPATVRVQYNFRFLIPGFSGGNNNLFRLAAESTMRLE